MRILTYMPLLFCLVWLPCCYGEDVLFEDTFDEGLSKQWQIVGLKPEDYRIRDGGLELRILPAKRDNDRPMLKVDLPFTTAETVSASVEVTVVDQSLKRGELAGLFLTDQDGVRFGAKKTNIDGYFVFSPGEVDFIGKPGEEGDPGKYTVKYWPADQSAGAIRIIVRGHYAHFQVGPSSAGKYMTLFHSAIQKADKGLGFALMVVGEADDRVRWVRFDNFRVTR